jgi:hypothetical protein
MNGKINVIHSGYLQNNCGGVNIKTGITIMLTRHWYHSNTGVGTPSTSLSNSFKSQKFLDHSANTCTFIDFSKFYSISLMRY